MSSIDKFDDTQIALRMRDAKDAAMRLAYRPEYQDFLKTDPEKKSDLPGAVAASEEAIFPNLPKGIKASDLEKAQEIYGSKKKDIGVDLLKIAHKHNVPPGVLCKQLVTDYCLTPSVARHQAHVQMQEQKSSSVKKSAPSIGELMSSVPSFSATSPALGNNNNQQRSAKIPVISLP